MMTEQTIAISDDFKYDCCIANTKGRNAITKYTLLNHNSRLLNRLACLLKTSSVAAGNPESGIHPAKPSTRMTPKNLKNKRIRAQAIQKAINSTPS